MPRPFPRSPRHTPPTEYAMTTAEVAAAMQISESMVNVLEKRALEKCRRCFAHIGLSFDDAVVHLRHDDCFPGHEPMPFGW